MNRMIEGAGVPLSVQDAGPSGAPVVLVVHGMAADAQACAPAAEQLVSHGLRVITYDRRGYGASGAPEPYSGTTVAEQAADALAVLDGHRVPAATVAGDGFGALVALDLALRFPERVSALVCADPPLLLLVADATRALARERAQLEEALRSGGPAAAVAVWLDGRVDDGALLRAQASARGFFADYAGLASLAVTRRELRAVCAPAVVVTGPSTPPDVDAAADALAQLVPQARRERTGGLVGAVRMVTG